MMTIGIGIGGSPRTPKQAEIAKYEEEQGVEERQRVAIIRDLHERAEAQRAANDAWAEKVEESQSVADGLAKKVRQRKGYVLIGDSEKETARRLRRLLCPAQVCDLDDRYQGDIFSPDICALFSRLFSAVNLASLQSQDSAGVSSPNQARKKPNTKCREGGVCCLQREVEKQVTSRILSPWRAKSPSAKDLVFVLPPVTLYGRFLCPKRAEAGWSMMSSVSSPAVGEEGKRSQYRCIFFPCVAFYFICSCVLSANRATGSVDMLQDPVRSVPTNSGQGRHRGAGGRPAGPGEHPHRAGHHGVQHRRLYEPY